TGDGITDQGGDVLDRSSQITDLSGSEPVYFDLIRLQDTQFGYLEIFLVGHESYSIPGGNGTVQNPKVYDYAPVAVVETIKNQSSQRLIMIVLGRRHIPDYSLQHIFDTDIVLGTGLYGVVCGPADDVLDLLSDSL